MIRVCLLLLGVLCSASFLSSQAHGAVFTSTYDFTGPSAAATTVGAVTASNFADGTGTLNFDTSNGNPVPSVIKAFSDIGLTSGLNYQTTTSYFTFTITPNVGFSEAVTSIQFDYQRDNAPSGNPTFTYDLRSSSTGDNYATSLGTATVSDNSGHFATDLVSPLSATDTVTYRIYISSSSAQTSTTTGAHLDNVVVTGNTLEARGVLPTPEPASLVIWGLGALGCAFGGYRRRKIA
jgi:hypothetical protein